MKEWSSRAAKQVVWTVLDSNAVPSKAVEIMRLTSFLNLSFNQDNQWASTLETTFTEEKQKQEIIKTGEQDGKNRCYTRENKKD